MPDSRKLEFWIEKLPFPVAMLANEERFGDRWDWVHQSPTRWLMRKRQSRMMLWAMIDGARVVALDKIKGVQRLAAMEQFGWTLHPRHHQQIERALVIGAPYFPCFKTLYGAHHQRFWVTYLPKALGGGQRRHYHSIELTRPYRRGILCVDTDAQDCILAYEIIDGPQGIALERTLMATKTFCRKS